MKKVKSLFQVMLYCFKISIEASTFCTLARVLIKIVLVAIPILNAYTMRYIINLIATTYSEDLLSSLIMAIIALLLLSLTSYLLGSLSAYIVDVHNIHMKNSIDIKLAQIAVQMDLKHFDSPEYFDKFSNAKRDSSALITITWNIIDGFGSFLSLISAFCILAQLNIVIGIFVIVSIIPSFIVSQKYTRKIYHWEKENVMQDRQCNYLYNIMTGKDCAQDLRLLGIGPYLLSLFKTTWSAWFGQKKVLLRKRTIFTTIANLNPIVISTIFIGWIAVEIFIGKREIGDFTLYTSQVQQLQTSVTAFIVYTVNIYDSKLKVNNIQSFQGIVSDVVDGQEIITGTIDSIEFRNVSFSYPGCSVPVLNDVCFKVESGDSVAIVGLNGSGKTTIIKLLLRFYSPSSGQIYINGKDITQYDLGSLRQKFDVMFQEFNVYAFTLKENIGLSDLCNTSKNTDARIQDALRTSGADSILNKLPQGLNTYLSREFSEEGVKLSKGEEQKIALARMLYRDSEVILLDEPSASLDAEAENKVFNTIKELNNGKTVIFITHRLANIKIAKKIFVLENGRIIESGSHDDLMKLSGRYATLYNYQAEKFSI